MKKIFVTFFLCLFSISYVFSYREEIEKKNTEGNDNIKIIASDSIFEDSYTVLLLVGSEEQKAYVYFLNDKETMLEWYEDFKAKDHSEIKRQIEYGLKYYSVNSLGKSQDGVLLYYFTDNVTSSFKGVWGCNFGMKKEDVCRILCERGYSEQVESQKDKETISLLAYDNENILKANNKVTGFWIPFGNDESKSTYGNLQLSNICFTFIDDKLAVISVGFAGNENFGDVNLVASSIVEKNNFKKLSEWDYVDDEKSFIFSSIISVYQSDEVFFYFLADKDFYGSVYSYEFQFLDKEIRTEAVNRIKQQKMKALLDSDDF